MERKILCIFLLLVQAHQIVGISKTFYEFISDPINFSAKDSKVIQHAELPVVTDELSVTLRLNLLSKNSNWSSVFHKGVTDIERTPSLWMTPNNSAPHVRFSLNDNWNAGIDSLDGGLSLNQWYHLAYTLSEPQKRLDFYIDGKWAGFQSFQQVQTEQLLFNNGPLRIGTDTFWDGIVGQISNFRYYNWCLSADEVTSVYTNSPFIQTSTNSTSNSTTPTSFNPSTTITYIPSNGNITCTKNDTALMVGIGVGASIGVFMRSKFS
ncbi:2715_t:CDS:2 [Ambispora leptoticha]|uniref:2715_t:CDS:1 n=1 Tax=Ambispora leptoticha TaxID=144679 RepID=A0A9N9BZY0_9GLOM|nr:2715_t:CDS:2 [Ambispora leptoticha]